jgi:hypothetical protein
LPSILQYYYLGSASIFTGSPEPWSDKGEDGFSKNCEIIYNATPIHIAESATLNDGK